MDPHPLRLLETAPPLRSSTLSANPANSRFRVPQDHRLASSEVVNKISSKTLTDQLRSLVPVAGLAGRSNYESNLSSWRMIGKVSPELLSGTAMESFKLLGEFSSHANRMSRLQNLKLRQ